MRLSFKLSKMASKCGPSAVISMACMRHGVEVMDVVKHQLAHEMWNHTRSFSSTEKVKHGWRASQPCRHHIEPIQERLLAAKSTQFRSGNFDISESSVTKTWWFVTLWSGLWCKERGDHRLWRIITSAGKGAEISWSGICSHSIDASRKGKEPPVPDKKRKHTEIYCFSGVLVRP